MGDMAIGGYKRFIDGTWLAADDGRAASDRAIAAAEEAVRGYGSSIPSRPEQWLSVLRQSGAEGIDEYLDVKLLALVAR